MTASLSLGSGGQLTAAATVVVVEVESTSITLLHYDAAGADVSSRMSSGYTTLHPLPPSPCSTRNPPDYEQATAWVILQLSPNCADVGGLPCQHDVTTSPHLQLTSSNNATAVLKPNLHKPSTHNRVRPITPGDFEVAASFRALAQSPAHSAAITIHVSSTPQAVADVSINAQLCDAPGVVATNPLCDVTLRGESSST